MIKKSRVLQKWYADNPPLHLQTLCLTHVTTYLAMISHEFDDFRQSTHIEVPTASCYDLPSTASGSSAIGNLPPPGTRGPARQAKRGILRDSRQP